MDFITTERISESNRTKIRLLQLNGSFNDCIEILLQKLENLEHQIIELKNENNKLMEYHKEFYNIILEEKREKSELIRIIEQRKDLNTLKS